MDDKEIHYNVEKYYISLFNNSIKYTLKRYPDRIFFFYDDNLLRNIKFSRINGGKLKLDIFKTEAIAELDLKNKIFWLIDSYMKIEKIIPNKKFTIQTTNHENIIINVICKKYNLDTLKFINKSKIWKIESYKNEQKM